MNYHYYIGAFIQVPKELISRSELDKFICETIGEDKLFFATFELEHPKYHALMCNQGTGLFHTLDSSGQIKNDDVIRYVHEGGFKDAVSRLEHEYRVFIKSLSERIDYDVRGQFGIITAYS